LASILLLEATARSPRQEATMAQQLTSGTDAALLLMRLVVALIFAASGWKHAKDPAARAQSIGMSKGFTLFLGVAELLGALGVAVGALTQFAAAGLILVMLGAIQKKAFVWKTGLWGKNGTDGWHYDLMLLVMCLVILCTDGGRFTLLP
jgi:putative oxidoreductase